MNRYYKLIALLVFVFCTIGFVNSQDTSYEKLPSINTILTLDWKVELNLKETEVSIPTIIDGLVFVNGERQRCFDLISGKEIFFRSLKFETWAKSKPHKYLKTGSYFDGMINKYVFLNLELYREIKVNISGWKASKIVYPVDKSGLVYIKNYHPEGSVSIYNLNERKHLWSNQDIGWSSSYLIVNDELYNYDRKRLYCTDVNTGKLLWQYEAGSFDAPLLMRENGKSFLYFSEKGVLEVDVKRKKVNTILEIDLSQKKDIFIENDILYANDIPLAYSLKENRYLYNYWGNSFSSCAEIGGCITEKYLFSNFRMGCEYFAGVIVYDRNTVESLYFEPVEEEILDEPQEQLGSIEYPYYFNYDPASKKLLAVKRGVLYCFTIQR